MPDLYSLGPHDALGAIKRQLLEKKHLFAYLDEIYNVCRPDKAKSVFELIKNTLSAHTGTL